MSDRTIEQHAEAVRGSLPDDTHHHLCATARGGECDCYNAIRGIGPAHESLAALALLAADAERLREALDAIARNAEAWHAGEDGKVRALAVIARWARDPASVPPQLLASPPADTEQP